MIRKQDATFTINYIAGNPIGQPLAWDFIRANWDHIFNKWVFSLFNNNMYNTMHILVILCKEITLCI